jgi:hypothetical protein
MWASVSVGDSNKGNSNKVVKTNEYVSLPFPCSDSTDCTHYSVTLESGIYDLEVWGAQGGNDTSYPTTVFGGRGGYSKGTVQLKSRTTLYVYVGGSGTGSTSGGRDGSTGGGGAIDIRLQNGAWNDASGLRTRIIVAGGGGGRHGRNYENTAFVGNDGGGTTAPSYSIRGETSASGATQTSSGSSSNNCGGVAYGSFGYANPNSQSNVNSKGGYNGGARGSDVFSNGGAGGGWWGGITVCSTSSGGSGFVYTSSNSQCSASSDYYLSNTSIFSGNTNFLSPFGGNELGHRGNGFARITNIRPFPTPSASKDSFSLYHQCYSYCVNRRSSIFIPLMSFIIFSLIKDEISFDLLPIVKLG